jgi:hypothetical protein
MTAARAGSGSAAGATGTQVVVNRASRKVPPPACRSAARTGRSTSDCGGDDRCPGGVGGLQRPAAGGAAQPGPQAARPGRVQGHPAPRERQQHLPGLRFLPGRAVGEAGGVQDGVEQGGVDPERARVAAFPGQGDLGEDLLPAPPPVPQAAERRPVPVPLRFQLVVTAVRAGHRDGTGRRPGPAQGGQSLRGARVVRAGVVRAVWFGGEQPAACRAQGVSGCFSGPGVDLHRAAPGLVRGGQHDLDRDRLAGRDDQGASRVSSSTRPQPACSPATRASSTNAVAGQQHRPGDRVVGQPRLVPASDSRPVNTRPCPPASSTAAPSSG